VSADEHSATLLLDSGEERSIAITAIDKARTVFAFGPGPKPGAAKPGAGKSKATKNPKPSASKSLSSKKETQSS
jgi:ribosome maturation factor RimP